MATACSRPVFAVSMRIRSRSHGRYSRVTDVRPRRQRVAGDIGNTGFDAAAVFAGIAAQSRPRRPVCRLGGGIAPGSLGDGQRIHRVGDHDQPQSQVVLGHRRAPTRYPASSIEALTTPESRIACSIESMRT